MSARLTTGATASHVWTRGASRRKKVLYVSSPIGLGHVRRDLAIASELRQLHPDIEIEWLAQDPVTAVLRNEGEAVHPASAWLASESAHIASEACGHDLHCFQALRNMDEILVANFMLFQEVIEDGLYDLVVGDEAWDVDHYWHENPELKRGSHVWMTDFVGYLPMPDGGDHEAFLTADYNAEMIEHIANFPRIRDRSIFVGNSADVVPETFGRGLPSIRDWTEAHFDFSGYITGFSPPTPDQVAQWRSELGYCEDEQICIITVGGSGVGQELLEMAIAAHPIARRTVPGLRTIAVAGPRIDPDSLPRYPGLEVRGYVDRLFRHLAVCDLAIVQGGLTTTMELTASKRPFIYFPLAHHFEQNFHVRHRLDHYGAGTYMDYATTDPERLAEAIAGTIGQRVDYHDVETDGARRAAAMIAELV
jgi:predicted glycosyltransferase